MEKPPLIEISDGLCTHSDHQKVTVYRLHS
jgi:hypothetical protein